MQTSISVILATLAVLSVGHPVAEPHKLEVPTTACAEGWTHFNVSRKCYKLVKDVTFLQGLRQCHDLGAKLVSIHSEEENQFLADFARPQSEKGSFFIGLVRNDIHETWDWVDLSDYEYSNWGLGEPNNTGNDENCVVEWTLDFSNRPTSVWNDVWCHGVKDVVCEMSSAPVCSEEECIVSTVRDVVDAVDSYEV